MNRVTRPAWAEINLANLAHNVQQFKRLIPQECNLMAVVKANAYGHGDLQAAGVALANGATWLAVALPEEGVRLRRSGIAAPILVLGAIGPDQLEMCVAKDLAVTVFQWEIVTALSNLARKSGKTVRVHIKVDTGMGRLGLAPENVVEFVQRVKGLPNLELQGIYTHFASSEEPEQDYANWQWSRFQRVLQELKRENIHIQIKHCANTAATLFMPQTRLDMVRVGLGLYGMYPSSQHVIPLKPVFSLKARVAAVKRVPPGTGISYNSTYVTWKETTIAVIPIGYADGVCRALSNNARVLVGGMYFPLVGRVTMDHIMVDVGNYQLEVGEEVVLIGRQHDQWITADHWGEWIGTINYEIPCMISERVPRIYV